jgi:HAE1 family hydrophobic/amphiphilic exporter-1
MGAPQPGYSSGQAIEALRRVAAQVLARKVNGYEFAGLSREEIDNSGNMYYHHFFLCQLYLYFSSWQLCNESWSVPFLCIAGRSHLGPLALY